MKNINFTIIIFFLAFILGLFKNEIVVIFNKLFSLIFKNKINFSSNFYIIIILLFFLIISLLLISFVLYDVNLFCDFKFYNHLNTSIEIIKIICYYICNIYNLIEPCKKLIYFICNINNLIEPSKELIYYIYNIYNLIEPSKKINLFFLQ